MVIVMLENFQPSRDIRCVFFASLLVQFEIGARESTLQLLQCGNMPFAGTAFITPALAALVAVKAAVWQAVSVTGHFRTLDRKGRGT
jgi:hypothetical protein